MYDCESHILPEFDMSTKFFLSLAHTRETCDQFLDRVDDTLPELPS